MTIKDDDTLNRVLYVKATKEIVSQKRWTTLSKWTNAGKRVRLDTRVED